jgi:hypothetical protein
MTTIFIWHVYTLPTALDGLAPRLSLAGVLLFWRLGRLLPNAQQVISPRPAVEVNGMIRGDLKPGGVSA